MYLVFVGLLPCLVYGVICIRSDLLQLAASLSLYDQHEVSMRNFFFVLFFLFLPLAACEPLVLTTVPDVNGYVPSGAAAVTDKSTATKQSSRNMAAQATAPATTKERTAAWPDKVAFKGKVLLITLNDGAMCEGDTLGASNGTISACKWPLKYAIANFYPRPFQGAPGVIATAHPYTQVTLTAPNGLHWVFQTPIVSFQPSPAV